MLPRTVGVQARRTRRRSASSRRAEPLTSVSRARRRESGAIPRTTRPSNRSSRRCDILLFLFAAAYCARRFGPYLAGIDVDPFGAEAVVVGPLLIAAMIGWFWWRPSTRAGARPRHLRWRCAARWTLVVATLVIMGL